MRDWTEVVAIGCAMPGVEQGSSYGRPVVLVRYGTDAGDRIAPLLRRAWWDRATVAQRKAWGERP